MKTITAVVLLLAGSLCLGQPNNEVAQLKALVAKQAQEIAALKAELAKLRRELAETKGPASPAGLLRLGDKGVVADATRQFRHGIKVGDIGSWHVAEILEIGKGQTRVLVKVWTTDGQRVNARQMPITLLLDRVDASQLADGQTVFPPGLWKVTGTMRVGNTTYLVCQPHTEPNDR